MCATLCYSLPPRNSSRNPNRISSPNLSSRLKSNSQFAFIYYVLDILNSQTILLRNCNSFWTYPISQKNKTTLKPKQKKTSPAWQRISRPFETIQCTCPNRTPPGCKAFKLAICLSSESKGTPQCHPPQKKKGLIKALLTTIVR